MIQARNCVQFVHLLVTCTPFGNFRYNRLPMGISQSPDIAQETMEDLFRNFDEVDCYIDDVGIFSNDWDAHCASLTTILQQLEQHNFTITPLNSIQGTD